MFDFVKYFYPDEKATDAPAFPNRHPKRKKDTQAGQFAASSAWVSFSQSAIFFSIIFRRAVHKLFKHRAEIITGGKSQRKGNVCYAGVGFCQDFLGLLDLLQHNVF